MSVAFDRDEALRWISLAYPEDVPGQLSIWRPDTHESFAVDRSDSDRLVDVAQRWDADGVGSIYLRTTTVKEGVRGRGGADDTVALAGLWSDLDWDSPHRKFDPSRHGGLVLPPDEDAVRQIVAASGLPKPTAWVHSGYGLYSWWLLTGHSTDLETAAQVSEQYQEALRRAAASLGLHYGNVGNLDRLLRLPGSVNRKGGLEVPCRIEHVVDRRGRFTLSGLAGHAVSLNGHGTVKQAIEGSGARVLEGEIVEQEDPLDKAEQIVAALRGQQQSYADKLRAKAAKIKADARSTSTSLDPDSPLDDYEASGVSGK